MAWRFTVDKAQTAGSTAEDEGWLATFELAEEVRPEAPAVVKALKNMGLTLKILSGDGPAAVAQVGWEGLLVISELMPSYTAKYGKDITPRNVMDFMVRDESNPSSICSCLRAARENSRAVRGALTTELWETQNSTWLKLAGYLKSKDFDRYSALITKLGLRKH